MRAAESGDFSRAITECADLLFLAAEALRRMTSARCGSDDAMLRMCLDELTELAVRLRVLGEADAQRGGH